MAQLEEVVVTARARAESLQDVPSTVTAFTASQISDMGIQRATFLIDASGTIVETWPKVIGQRNPELAASIERQLQPKPGLRRLLERLRHRLNGSGRNGSRAVIAPTSHR